jgi:hypothetical protein
MLKQCFGRTRNLHRCGRTGDWKCFCPEHRYQPLKLVFALVFTVAAGIASMHSAWWPKSSNLAPLQSLKVNMVDTLTAFKSYRTSFEFFGQEGSASDEHFKSTEAFAPSVPISDRFTVPVRTTIAHAGKYSVNFIPKGNPITKATETNYAVAPTVAVSAAVLDMLFDVAGSSTLDLSFFVYSTSSPKPTQVGNCESGLNVYVQRDNGVWTQYMYVCGRSKDEKKIWGNAQFRIPTNNASTMKLGFQYELQNNFKEDPEAMYLIDDLDVRPGLRK